MGIGIVIPVWNLWDKMTFPCLQSLLKHTNLNDIHVYLVDNASTDKTATHAEKIGQSLFGASRFTYIKNQENMGFAIACNQGAEQAKKDGHAYILFLNNDTVVTAAWLPPLVNALENPRVGMVGPLLLFPDKTVQHCGVTVTPIQQVGHIYHGFLPAHPAVLRKRKFRIITGAVLLCRTEQFFALGKFFEGYKNGMEDIDLCYTYVEQGFMHQVVSESIVYHYTSQTEGRLDGVAGLQNGKLLLERKPQIIPDAHLYYVQDGYLPALTKDFVFYPRLSEEKRKELNKAVLSSYSDELCKELLLKEPFWHDGYQIFIKSLLKQGKVSDAFAYCQRAISYCFSERNLKLLLELAQTLNDEKIYEDVKSVTLKQLAEMKEKKIIHEQKFHQLMQGNKWHDKLLATRELDTEEFGIY